MLTIVSAIKPETAVSLLQPEICRRVSTFLNMTDSDEVFDYLWDNRADVDLVVVEGSDVDPQELHAASRERPQSIFIVFGSADLDLTSPSSNVVIVTSPAELCQAVVSNIRY